jgi:hypothetical protein
VYKNIVENYQSAYTYMLYILSFFISILFSVGACAQTNHANLLAQSPDGKTVKLVWFFNNISPNVSGFDIKRKDGLEDWKKINSMPIVPGIALKKDLAPTGIDNAEGVRISEKLRDLLKAGTLKEYTYNDFVTRWSINDKAIQDIFTMAEIDYDISLMVGLGFEDHGITQKTDYQYGLFISGTDSLLAQLSWNYGEIPDLNVIQEITSRTKPGTQRGVQLLWTADMQKMKTGYVTGFNIYKKGIRMNDRPISTQESGTYIWADKNASINTLDQYSISAESLFGIEGIIKSYTFNPTEHPAEYHTPVVTNVTSQGYYFKDGTLVQWTFPQESEKFIKGFYVEKDNIPNGYIKVSELLPPSARSFSDKTGSQANYYIRARVIAVYNDKSQICGLEKLYSYFASPEAPKPQNTALKVTVESKNTVLYLSWDPPINGDKTTHHYRIYQFDNLNDKFVMLADNIPANNTVYRQVLPPSGLNKYKFYVVALNRAGSESMQGDTVSWQVGSPDEKSDKK